MRRLASSVALVALIGSSTPAFAQKPTDAAKARLAAEQFDAAVAALKRKDFESAASSFEAADAAVPSPQAIRQAIKARLEAGQGSRAATLAALALQRYPGDAATSKVSKDAIEKVGPLLAKVSVSCAPPCLLAVGTRSVPGEANTRRTVYLDPGPTTVSASFTGGAGTAQRDIDAKAGAALDVRFEPEDKSAPPAAAAAAPAAAAPHAAPAAEPEPHEPAATEPDQAKPSSGGLPKGVFIASLGVTVVLGGVTVWSGIDTQTNPGVEKVRAACAGKGESCPLYQDGLAKETRTNVLIGATAGAAAITIGLAVFTRWRDPKPASALITPGYDHGPALAARGTF